MQPLGSPEPSANACCAPLSFEQERFWLLEQLGPQNPVHNLAQAARLSGRLDLGQLEQSLRAVVKRHEILRTTYRVLDGQPQQVIAEDAAVRLPRIDLRGLPRQAREQAAAERASALAREPFELAAEPPWRACVLRLAEHEHLLVLVMHHILCDGDESLAALFREIVALHEDLVGGRASSLPALGSQYQDYARWQRQSLTDEALAPQLAYWKQRLGPSVPGLHLPTDRPRPTVQTYAGGTMRVTLPPALRAQLHDLSARASVPLSVLLLAAFKVLLHRYSRQKEIAVGWPASGRRAAGRQGLIGYFGNPLVLLSDLSDNPSFATLLQREQELVSHGEENQDYPFQKLVALLAPTRDMSMPPLCQVLFLLRASGEAGPESGAEDRGLSFATVDVSSGLAAYDLTLSALDARAELSLSWEYNADLFERATIGRMAAHFEILLGALLADPQARIGAVPILTAPEERQLMTEWNSVARTPYSRECIHHLIEQQVERTAELAAVEFEGQVLSYRELNERANQLAHFLQKLGVGPDRFVGICMDRGIEMVVAILATLKAGGAYVPLDAAYPEERLRYMLADSGAQVVLTTAETLAAAPQIAELTRDLHTLAVDARWPEIATESRTNPVSSVRPHHLAYCLYTSGSTGQPKGASMEHGALCNLMAWHRDHWLSEVGTRILLFSPISFDVSFHEIAAGLCTGGTLIQLREAVRRNALALLELILSGRVEKIYVPFIALQQLAQAAEDRGVTSTPLREVIVGGEPLQITAPIARLLNRPGIAVHNQYGSTECLVVTAHTLVGGADRWPVHVPVGKPTIYNTRVYVLDENLQHVPIGVIGEIYADSDCLARDYHGRPDLTAERFLQNPFVPQFGSRLYKLGDLGRYQLDGTIECLGRSDHQVKIRGFRVELGEIEAALLKHPRVAECVVMPREDVPGNKRLVGYVVPASAGPSEELGPLLRAYLKESLPEYMVPAVIMVLEKMPLLPSGKVYRGGLPAPDANRHARSALVLPQSELEERIARVFQEVLRIDQVSTQDNFFDLGGSSLLIVQVHRRLGASLGIDVPTMALFLHPTVAALAAHLQTREAAPVPETPRPRPSQAVGQPIAIIGAACRFPGAGDVESFWRNIRDGVESITTFTPDELEIAPALAAGATHVRAGGLLPDVERFDARFFGLSPREAALTDPQQRLLLECAWEAFEHAGYSPETYPGRVGVYVGCGLSTYLINNVLPAQDFSPANPFVEANSLPARLGTDRNYFATRVSYKLNLTGPSLTLQSACSTSLVSVHAACQSLRSGECELALAGGVTVTIPQKTGYPYEEGLIRSPDGHCRAFDAEAAGTVFSNGIGVVLLKPLARALADGDTVYAVIKGSAVNNDGAKKVGYAAPSVEQQAAVVTAALADAGVDARTVGYVEAHGTATVLGDPLEVTALTRAFGPLAPGDAGPYCALGSVKTNIGHTDEAAGIAGLLKAAWALKQRELPPSLHFRTPNPAIDFTPSPFYVSTRLLDWPASSSPRRAGVSSFGMGGTNCHVVLEEPPPVAIRTSTREDTGEDGPLLLALSAQTRAALRELAGRYIAHLDTSSTLSLADLCFTANAGRKHFSQRGAILFSDRDELRARLAALSQGESAPELVLTPESPREPPRKVAFLFTGQGAQYVDMGRHLYSRFPVFRAALERCNEILRPLLDAPLLDVLYPDRPGSRMERAESAARLAQTAYTQPALFALEYGLAQLWRSWGIVPSVVLGHSVGEYVAAWAAGILSLEDGLRLVALRGRLMQALSTPGSMLSVETDEATARRAAAPYAGTVAVAAVNGPQSTVLSGLAEHVAAIATELCAAGIRTKPLEVSHAFHSPLMEPMQAEFGRALAQIAFAPPKIPLVTNLTGLADAAALCQPGYWQEQLRQPVQLAASMATLAQLQIDTLIELGPRPVLLGLGRQCLPEHAGLWLPSLRPRAAESACILTSLATFYASGGQVDWAGFAGGGSDGAGAPVRRRIPLPTYPFQRERHWIDAPHCERRGASPIEATTPADVPSDGALLARPESCGEGRWNLRLIDAAGLLVATLHDVRLDLPIQSANANTAATAEAQWLYDVAWQQAGPELARPAAPWGPGHWLVFADFVETGMPGLGEATAALLRARKQRVMRVSAGSAFARAADDHFVIDPLQSDDFQRLLEAARGRGPAETAEPLAGVLYLWGAGSSAVAVPADEVPDCAHALSAGALHLVQALGRLSLAPPLWLVTRGTQAVAAESVEVTAAPLWGLGRTLWTEQPELACRCVDLDPAELPPPALAAQLVDLVSAVRSEPFIALRHGAAYVARLRSSVRREDLGRAGSAAGRVVAGAGSYLITGGLGGLGLKVAAHLVAYGARRLVLAGRQGAVSAEAQRAVADLEAAGAAITVVAGDVARSEDAAAMLAAAQAQAPLAGIVHAAGVLDDGILAHQSAARFARVMAPKLAGAWNLHRLSLGLSLDFFIMFSSDAALLGYGGQGNYAAANAFVDALAHHRRALGLPALAINWGPWATVGMSASLAPPLKARMEDQGLHFMPVEAGLRVLDLALAEAALARSAPPQLAVLPVDFHRWMRQYGEMERPTLLQYVAPSSANDAAESEARARATAEQGPVQAPAAPARPRFSEALAAAPPGERRARLLAALRQLVGDVLGSQAGRELELQQGFFDYGLDSLTAIELRNLLQSRLQVALSQTVIFTYPTLEQLAEHLMRGPLAAAFVHLAERVPDRARERRSSAAADALAQLSDEQAEALLLKELAELEALKP